MKRLLIFILTLLFAIQLNAQQLRLASVFGDHMVIQQGNNAPVWGWAAPGQLVKVEMAGFTSVAKTQPDGKWMVRMPLLDYGGPYVMTVIAADTIKLKDVMVGEVWLASGQSNMEWVVGMGIGPKTDETIKQADFPNIRYFTTPYNTSVIPLANTSPAEWKPVTTETVKGLSAVAYFFARDLHQHRGVAVGILSSSWGATSAHAWMSSEILGMHPDFKEVVKNQDKNPANWEAVVANSKWNDQHRDSIATQCQEGIKNKVFSPEYNDSEWKTISYPANNEKIGMQWFWGVSWFRNSFEIPQLVKEGKLTLFLRGKEVSLYLNGKEISKLSNVEKEVTLSIPKGLLKKGKNILAVRLYEVWGTGLIGSSASIPAIITDKNEHISLNDTWKASGAIEPQIPGNQGYYNQYSVQYNARIAPLIPYGIKGVIWYQGEGNSSKAFQYRTLFPMLIEDWRTRWGQGYMPFLFVQLANHKEKKQLPDDDQVAELREAQALTLSLPNTGMAYAIDIGDALDIHPRNKLDVGKRLYLAARKVAYGENTVSSGPVYDGFKVEGNQIRVSISSVGGGLIVKDNQQLKGFCIAGADKKFYWADAKLDGNTVLVSSPQVPNPEAVRYSWEINPDGNLFNREGLPTVPFRTDNFKMITE